MLPIPCRGMKDSKRLEMSRDDRIERLIRQLIEMVTENLAISRETIGSHERMLTSHEKIETTNSRMDMGIYSLIKKTDIILGFTQRLEAYKSGDYYYLLLDEWTVFFAFFFLHPFFPAATELIGSIMLYALSAHRLFISNHKRQKTTLLGFYFMSPYKAIFLLYWFLNEYTQHPMKPVKLALNIPLPGRYYPPSAHPTILLISFARYIALYSYAVATAILDCIHVSGIAQQINIYLLFELHVCKVVLGAVYSFLSIALAGIFTGVYQRACALEIPMPFGTVIQPLYYICP